MNMEKRKLILEIYEDDILSESESVIRSYINAIKTKRGVDPPFISVYIPNYSVHKFTIRNNKIESYEMHYKSRILASVHYTPSKPAYYWQDGLDIKDALWKAELNGWENYGAHLYSQKELPEYKLLHPEKPSREKVRVKDITNDEKFEEGDIPEVIEIAKNLNENVLSINGIKYVRTSVETGVSLEIYLDSHGAKIIQEYSYWYLVGDIGVPCEDLEDRILSFTTTHGAFGGLGTLKILEKEILNSYIDTANECIKFSKARSSYKNFNLTSGTYKAVLNGKVVGTSIHEYGGHLVEAHRLLESNEASIFKGKLGKKIAPKKVTLIDDSRIKFKDIIPVSYYKYDAEGVEKKSTTIIKEGVFNSFLHTKLTAGTLPAEEGGGILTGNARVDIEEKKEKIGSVPRMSTLYLKPGDYKLEELLEEAKGGLYISSGSPAGYVETSNGMGSVEIEKIYYIDKNLDLVPIRVPKSKVYLNGDSLTFLRNIEEVGDKSTLSLDTSYCGAESGYVLHAIISPSVLVRKANLVLVSSENPFKKSLIEG
jgi:predicted Zn-dependent protease